MCLREHRCLCIAASLCEISARKETERSRWTDALCAVGYARRGLAGKPELDFWRYVSGFVAIGGVPDEFGSLATSFAVLMLNSDLWW